MPETGIEPARGLSPADFESAASASSATPASVGRSVSPEVSPQQGRVTKERRPGFWSRPSTERLRCWWCCFAECGVRSAWVFGLADQNPFAVDEDVNRAAEGEESLAASALIGRREVAHEFEVLW